MRRFVALCASIAFLHFESIFTYLFVQILKWKVKAEMGFPHFS